MPRTRFGWDGSYARRAGSFAGRAQSGVVVGSPRTRFGWDGAYARRAGSFVGKALATPVIDSLLCSDILAYCAVTGAPDGYAAMTGSPEIMGCAT